MCSEPIRNPSSTQMKIKLLIFKRHFLRVFLSPQLHIRNNARLLITSEAIFIIPSAILGIAMADTHERSPQRVCHGHVERISMNRGFYLVALQRDQAVYIKLSGLRDLNSSTLRHMFILMHLEAQLPFT